MKLFATTPQKVENWIAEKSVKKLLKSIDSSDPIIRRMVAEGLGIIGGPEVLKFCKDNARSDSSKLRWTITQILAQIGTPEALGVMETVEDPLGLVGKDLPKTRVQ
jgi:HEAT repeat protein